MLLQASSRGRRRRRRGNDRGKDRSSPRCQELEHLAEPASAQTPPGPDVPHLNLCAEEKHAVSAQALQKAPSLRAEEVAQATTEVSPPSGCCLSLSTGSPIFARFEREWGFTFYIRVDRQGSFHTYPDVGGPFESFQKADKAINYYLDGRRDPKMCMEQANVSSVEMLVRESLYWPDGTIKKRTKSYVTAKISKQMRRLVQALVDKYNEDHNLLEDVAYELKDVMHYQSILEKRMWYYHLDFNTKIKGADDLDPAINNLLFVEIKRMPQGKHEELLVSCFCLVNSIDDGQYCYGCTNHGSVGMKHPDSSVEFAAGHMDVCVPCGSYRDWSDSDDDDQYVKRKEAKLRHMYKGLDDPRVVEELFTLPPGVTIVED